MKPKPTICVFCGSSLGGDPAYAENATLFGRLLGERGWTLVYGGGASGLMGELARAAGKAGARVIGVRPDSLSHIEMPMERGLEIVKVADLFERKKMMMELSDAFATLPGGIGTLDEFLEVVTTRQLGLHDKPLVLLNARGFFDPVLDFVFNARKEGFVYRPPEAVFRPVATPQEAIAYLSEHLRDPLQRHSE